MEEGNKIKRANRELNQGLENEIEPNEANLNQPTENILNEILKSLENIHKNIGSLPQTEIKNTSEELFIVHKHVTTLAFRIGQIEKHNLELKNEVKELSKNKNWSPDSPLEVQHPGNTVNKAASFSDIVKFASTNNNSTATTKISEWRTPPHRGTKHETIVRVKGNDDPRKVMQEIKQNLRGTAIEGNFKRVKPLQSGSIIIECQDGNQQEKLKETLEKSNQNVEVKNILNSDPMIIITGILKGYTPETFIKEFVNDNPDILNIFGQDALKMFKYVTKRECRNTSKENWIFQIPPALFKWLIRNNTLVFDLSPAYIQEYTNVAMCFKCCLFGHVAKYCKSDVECCHKCGGNHKATECTISTLDCPNCKRSNLADRNHSARNPSCPMYLQRIRKLQQQTNYSNAETFLLAK